MVRRGSRDAAAAFAGARTVAVWTGSRHCCVGNQAAAAAATAAATAATLGLQCRVKLSSSQLSERAGGTLRHSKVAATLCAPSAAYIL